MQRDTYFDRVLDTNAVTGPVGSTMVAKCWDNSYGRYAIVGLGVFTLAFISFSIFTPDLFKTGKKKKRKRVWSRILTGATLLTLMLLLLPFAFRQARSRMGY